jgi:N-acetylglucosamine-6-phosphate deacetylase
MKADGVYSAAKIFTGDEWLQDHSIVVQDGRIKDVLPTSKLLVPVASTVDCLVPAFIDAQIYGAYGKLFSVFPEVDALQKLHDYCVDGGANHFLPTVATNTYEVFHACIDAVRKYWNEGGKGCLGLHIEGPWINKTKRGAHQEAIIHSPTVEQAKELLEYGKGVIKMITLATEICSKEVIELIKSYGIIISAGHSNATYEQAMQSFDEGSITTVTHLYNAMSPLQHREPGLVGAVFNHPTIMSSIIPDGYHVDFAAIKIAKKMLGERLFVITDAVTETNEGFYPHQMAGDKYESNNILSGSALTMKKAVQNLVEFCDVELDEALRMCSIYPAQVLNLDNELGKIEVGYKADFIEWNG